jgi:chromosome segregation ATPase
VSELESAAKKHNSRIRELETERDKSISKAHVLDAQLEEAKQALALAQQSAAHGLQLLQQQYEEAAAAAQQEHAATTAKLQEQLAAARAAAAACSEQAAAAAAERESALAAALADAQAAVTAQQAAAAEIEQRQRRALARMQDHVRQLEAEKQVRQGAGPLCKRLRARQPCWWTRCSSLLKLMLSASDLHGCPCMAIPS